MYPKFPKRSVNAKDILLLFLGWIVKKVLDFVWEKTSVRVRALKPRPLRVQSLGNWILRILCKMLGFRYVSDKTELQKLILDLKHHRARAIVLYEGGGLHAFRIPRDVATLLSFALSKDVSGLVM